MKSGSSFDFEIAHAMDVSGVKLLGLVARLLQNAIPSNITVKVMAAAVWPLDADPNNRYEDTATEIASINQFDTSTVAGRLYRSTVSSVPINAPNMRVIVRVAAEADTASPGSVTISVGSAMYAT